MYSKRFSVFASAKINIGLKVFPLRGDGFHPIEGIFQMVNLRDKLTVEIIDGSGRCLVSCRSMQLPAKNTITAAYDAFRSEVGWCPSVFVELKKCIPEGSGLGGGSADAAALIRGLERLTGIMLSNDQLDTIANKVGSDVFFFLHCQTGVAIVTGRGEKVQNIECRRNLFFVLVFLPVVSLTKEAYTLIDAADRLGRKSNGPLLSEIETIYNGPVRSWTFRNDFTEVLADKMPEVKKGLAALKQNGALFSEMSGSGSTVYGVFASSADAEAAVNALKAQGYNCIAVQ